jgi:hypothetical protein
VITRRRALAAAIAGLATHPALAFAADADAGPLTVLAAYHLAVIGAYDALIAKANGAERSKLRQLRSRAANAAAALPKPPSTTPVAADATLDQLIMLEEALIASCYTALENVGDERHLKGIAAFMADAGRRAVVLRELAGKPLLPRAFETGSA